MEHAGWQLVAFSACKLNANPGSVAKGHRSPHKKERKKRRPENRGQGVKSIVICQSNKL